MTVVWNAIAILVFADVTVTVKKSLMAKTKRQERLSAWGRQKWRTKSGKPSTQGPKATGERYLPTAAIKSLTPSEYAATTRAKRASKKQHAKQPKSIAKKTARFRRV